MSTKEKRKPQSPPHFDTVSVGNQTSDYLGVSFLLYTHRKRATKHFNSFPGEMISLF